MASEILAVPEDDLEFVIYIIQTGLNNANSIYVHEHKEAKKGLLKWCKEEEEYLKRLKEE